MLYMENDDKDQRIRDERATSKIILSIGHTQLWFPITLRLTTCHLIVLLSATLQLPGQTQKHPLYPQLKIIILGLSGYTPKNNQFIQRGEPAPDVNTTVLTEGGRCLL